MAARKRGWEMRRVVLLLLPCLAHGELLLHVYNNTGFGGALASSGTTAGGVSGATSVGCNQSAEYIGTLSAPVDQGGASLSFEAEVDRDVTTLRVWVSDFLVLDAKQTPPAGGSARARIRGVLSLPPSIARGIMLFRVHYARSCSTARPGWLVLQWGTEGAEPVTIPAGMLSPELSDAQQQREAMRKRLYEPRVPWQTYVHSSMSAHTLQPTGLVLRLGVADVGGSNPEDLGAGGHINPWPRFAPAHVLPGRHSLNGSDYTSFEVRGWGRSGEQPASRRDARLVFETTTLTPSGDMCNGTTPRCDLLCVVSCDGPDCADLAVSMWGTHEWGRSGEVALKDDSDLVFHSPGFPTVTAFAAWNTTTVPAAARTRRLLRFSGSGSHVGMSTGTRRDIGTMLAAIGAARVRADQVPQHLTSVADLALPMFDVLAWNTLFTTSLHVYTPVSRNWAGGNDDAATTFVWDVFFAAVMLACAGPDHERAADIAHANMITTVYSRTVTGMVPNYRSGIGGSVCTYDRTEPMVGAWSLQILHSVFGEANTWVVQLLWPPLLAWNEWVRDRRAAEGVLGAGLPGGRSALISLGSDNTTPPGQNTPHTLAAARYESGLDNSPQYDGNDGPGGNEGFGVGPVRFNGSTSHMKLYDVAFSVYHALDGQALLALGPTAGVNSSTLEALRTRTAATEHALHRDLYDSSVGSYANRLYNGTFYHRWAPTIFAPMLLNSTPAERVGGMMEIMGDAATFCVAAQDSATHLLWRMRAAAPGYMRVNQSITCASAGCMQWTVLGVADFAGIEAAVDSQQSAAAPVALHLYVDDSMFPDRCLSTRSPGPRYVLVNASAPPEGWCAPTSTDVYTQPLVLWYSPSLHDHRTCGGMAACAAAAMEAAGYVEVGTLCYARSSLHPGEMPCRYGLPSIARSDAAFWDQLYWRGRIWAPQVYLVWAGLQRYDHLPSAKTKRAQLAAQAERLFRQQLDLFGQVNENMNGVLGVGSDSIRADSYYHWGALNALVAIAERGLYPSPQGMFT
eukprot:Hpha_TRINITY_DN17106_c0_g1::TRINITY_DN17106_c0_g1_i1::g.146806::m.146806